MCSTSSPIPPLAATLLLDAIFLKYLLVVPRLLPPLEVAPLEEAPPQVQVAMRFVAQMCFYHPVLIVLIVLLLEFHYLLLCPFQFPLAVFVSAVLFVTVVF